MVFLPSLEFTPMAFYTENCTVPLEDVEFATLQWVWWFNHHRLLEPLGYVPPAEYEEMYYRVITTTLNHDRQHSHFPASDDPGAVHTPQNPAASLQTIVMERSYTELARRC